MYCFRGHRYSVDALNYDLVPIPHLFFNVQKMCFTINSRCMSVGKCHCPFFDIFFTNFENNLILVGFQSCEVQY
jgi:hypothetical protein